MKHLHSVLRLVAVTVFFGILISYAILYSANLFFSPESLQAPACYDGSVITAEDPISDFDRAVYQNQSSLSIIRELQYRLFGTVSDPSVLVGRNGFLFDVRDEENGYDYLADYNGDFQFTAEQHKAILEELERRSELCRQNGAQYILAIIPNAQTVYSGYMPAYLGDISKHTRLSVLKDALLAGEFYDFMDLTYALREHKSDGLLYNNTENSLNALGLYYVYSEVCNRFSRTMMNDTATIAREDLEFYRHMTSGKTIARRAGLADVVQNQTVSLSNNTALNYQFIYNAGALATTVLPEGAQDTPNLLLQFSNNWERLQSEPFFSNTFDRVTYQTDLSLGQEAFEQARPHVVVQFIYEYELASLLTTS